jgi:NADPH:quinone reductase-like Zn-dependent oxidoreductase
VAAPQRTGRTGLRAVAPAAPRMTAIGQDEYGEAEDVLRVEEIDSPQIGDDKVLLRVHAAGVDRGVWHLMTGLPYPIRLAGYGVRRSRTRVRGREVAGRVEAVGARVSTLKAGDEVFGVGEGCFAQHAGARADRLAPAPGTLSAAQAATVPLSALTVLQASGTTPGCSRGRGCWSSAPRAVSARSLCNSQRWSGPTVPSPPLRGRTP